MMSINEWSNPDEHVSCDACLEGLGAISSDKYFHAVFPSFIQDLHLQTNSLELPTIVVSLKMWGKHFMGKKIVVYCDNEASVIVLNACFSKDMFMQSCLRDICYLAAVQGFEVRARHIVGFENRAADYLSRWHSNYRNTVNLKSCIEGGNYREVEVLEEFFMFSHDWQISELEILELQCKKYVAHAYAVGTYKNIKLQWESYFLLFFITTS
jgi:hypothetical protein